MNLTENVMCEISQVHTQVRSSQYYLHVTTTTERESRDKHYTVL